MFARAGDAAAAVRKNVTLCSCSSKWIQISDTFHLMNAGFHDTRVIPKF